MRFFTDGFEPDALIFDFDGTVADSMPALVAQFRGFLDDRRLPYDDEVRRSFFVMGLDELGAYLSKRFGLDEPSEEVTRLIVEGELALYRQGIAFKPHAREFLEYVHTQGLPMGIATSASRPMVETFLEAHRAEHLFSAFSFSDEVGRGKEYPDVYLNAARQLGAAIEKCLVFEDATPSLRTAKAAGARTIAVRESTSQQDQTELEQSSDLIITDYRELMPGTTLPR